MLVDVMLELILALQELVEAMFDLLIALQVEAL